MNTSPFPGMDPFLEENPDWADFHNWFIRELVRLHRSVAEEMGVWLGAEWTIYEVDPSGEISMLLGSRDLWAGLDPELNFQIDPSRANGHESAGSGVALAAPKAIREVVLDRDEAKQVREDYLVVRTNDEQQRLIAVVELLSVGNKRGNYMTKYREKRAKWLTGPCHFMEIDLLRGGSNLSREMIPELEPAPYFIFVARKTGLGRMEEGYPLQLQDKLPVIGLPTTPSIGDLPLDLAAAFRSAYDLTSPPRGFKYNLDRLPPPDLTPADLEWTRQLLTTVQN